ETKISLSICAPSRDDAFVLQRGDVLPRVGELEQDLFGVLPDLGRRRHAARVAVLVERHRARHHLERLAVAGVDLGEETVEAGVLVGAQVVRPLDGRPRTGEAGERLAPVLVGPRAEELVEERDALLTVLLA